MPKYHAYLSTTGSTEVEIEADSPDEAVDAAYEANTPTLCHQCCGGAWSQQPPLGLGDWDVYEICDENGKVVWSDRREGGA